jgi:hypothetical protein
MTGSAFVVFERGWACSNEASLLARQKPIFETGNPMPVGFEPDGFTLNLQSPFYAVDMPENATRVECVFKDDNDIKTGLIGDVKSINNSLILNIFAKTNRISEILSKITLKK